MARGKANLHKSKSNDDLYKEMGTVKPPKNIDKKINPLKKKKSNRSLLKSSKSSKQKKKEEKKNENYEPPIQKLRIKKQKSMVQLSNNLTDRVQIDKFAKQKLQSLSLQQKQIKNELEERIKQIKKRNVDRVKQLQQFEEIHLKKVNNLIKQEKKKEDKLIQEYERTVEKESKIKSSRNQQEKADLQDWKAILQEKKKIEKLMKDYRKKHQILMKDQSPETIERLKKMGEKKDDKKEKKVQVKKQKAKGDAKQMGNQYLQFAKMLQQAKQQKKKVKLLDINIKNIDYAQEMVSKIARSTGNLSKQKKADMPLMILSQKQSKLLPIKSTVFNNKQSQETPRDKKRSVKIIENDKK